MLLKSLELQGFKSFPDKTLLEFHDGVTAVVGPNGSGKSNISDAVRWVLGEQSSKTLRGSKMEDVIFVGTQSRKSQGFAQVSLTFDNRTRLLNWDSDEVTVTRKYYRSGDSEYLINGSQVRLKEITQLFMDTGLGRDGYSVIGQGRIDEIVSAKSDDRRQIFEEAAGITKFRYRKYESERRLKLAEENLVRLRDILGELEGRIGPLKTQSEKAKQFLELAERKKTLEISLWSDQLSVSRQKLREQDDKVLAMQQSHNQASESLEQIAAQIQQAYQNIQDTQVKIESIRSEKEDNERKIAESHSLIAVLNNDISHNLADIQRILGELDSCENSGEQIAQEKQARSQELTELDAELTQIAQEIEENEGELLHLSEQRSAVSSDFEQLSAQLNRLVLDRSKAKLNIVAYENNLADAEQRAQQLDQNRRQRALEQENAADELREIDRLMEEIASRRESLNNSRSGYELKIKTQRDKFDQINAEYTKLTGQINERQQRSKILTDLERNLEGFAYSVKSVLGEARRGMLQGVRGTVAQLIELPDRYAVAVETALGGSLQHIVVNDEGVAKKAIRFLKERRAGRATFLPLTSVKGYKISQPGLDACAGYVGIASELVSFAPEYRPVIENLLGKTVVVEDLDDAVSIAKRYGYRFRIVTLDGQLVNAGGSLTGGSQNKNTGLLSRKNEIKQLTQEAEQLSAKRGSYEETLQGLSEKINRAKAQLQGVLSELTVLNEDQIRFEGDQKRLKLLTEQSEQTLATLAQEQQAAQKRVQELTGTIQSTRERLEEIQRDIEQAEKQVDGLKGSRDDLGQRRRELDSQINALRIRQAELAKDRQNRLDSLAELDTRSSSNQEAIEALRRTVGQRQQANQEIEQEIEQCNREIQRLTDRQAGVGQEIEQMLADKNRSELATTQLRQQEREQSLSREKLGQELARLEERKVAMQKEYDNIIAKLWEEYQVSPNEAQRMAVHFDDPLAAQGELGGIKGKIKALGNVNLGAIEEYKEVSERYGFMNVQLKDIESSKRELEKLIQDLTDNMKQLFVTTFNRINTEFQKVFVELFGGGRASLSLADPEEVLDCGIEIAVQPPGKIIKNLSSLSGGEKAFIAIAIYFAILKVSPSPFCILDEIEAALDDVNVNKFASYLKNIDEKTQFIVITHRRGTMEQADVLYGVTMQEEGVSKLLQLKVSELESQAMKLAQ